MSNRRRVRSRLPPSQSPSPPPASTSNLVRVVVAVGGVAVFLLGFYGDIPGVRSFLMSTPSLNFSSTPAVVKEFSHDSQAFLQGLEFDNNADEPKIMFESTGLYGRSVVRKYDVQSGVILAETRLDKKHFGEGLTVVESEVYQLTWRENTVLIYDAADLSQKRVLPLATEGWGICFDQSNRRIIISDGSDYLHFYSQETFALQGKVQVTQRFNNEHFKAVRFLNELEFIDGKVWANVWMENRIVIINPDTGIIEHELDMQHLVDRISLQGYQTHTEAVLNGIAFHRKTRTLLVSGKLWPTLYQVQTELI